MQQAPPPIWATIITRKYVALFQGAHVPTSGGPAGSEGLKQPNTMARWREKGRAVRCEGARASIEIDESSQCGPGCLCFEGDPASKVNAVFTPLVLQVAGDSCLWMLPLLPFPIDPPY